MPSEDSAAEHVGGTRHSGATRIERARVEWKDDEIATAIDVPVEILPNGWIYTQETGCYYPPSEVVEVAKYGE